MIEYNLTLTVLQGRNLGDRLTFNLEPGESLHLGRGKENDVVIPDPQVSKLHAFIELGESGPKLFDLKSTAGTLLMGFPVPSNGESLRQLDEFKLANTVLSVDWEKKEVHKGPTDKKKFKLDLKDKNTKLAIGGPLLLLLLALLAGGDSSPQAAVQSKAPVAFNTSKNYGFIKGGDHSHPYEVKLDIPAGNLNIEFEAKTALPITVYRDDKLIGRVGVTDTWERYSLLLKDQIEGDSGQLRFVANSPKDAAKLKEWAVNRVRYKDLTEEDSEDDKFPEAQAKRIEIVNDSLQDSLQSALVMFSTSGGMWNCRASLQQTLLIMLKVASEPGALIPISEETNPPSINRYQTEIEELLISTDKGVHSEDLNKSLASKEGKLVELLSEMESELWRRAINKLHSAMLAAKAQNYRQALLDRQNLDQSFPDKDDLRFKDTREKIDKVIPKKVLSKPDKYLRENK